MSESATKPAQRPTHGKRWLDVPKCPACGESHAQACHRPLSDPGIRSMAPAGTNFYYPCEATKPAKKVFVKLPEKAEPGTESPRPVAPSPADELSRVRAERNKLFRENEELKKENGEYKAALEKAAADLLAAEKLLGEKEKKAITVPAAK
jgi:hypothetical protein